MSPFGPSILPQPVVYFRNQPFLPSPAPRNANISPFERFFSPLATQHSFTLSEVEGPLPIAQNLASRAFINLQIPPFPPSICNPPVISSLQIPIFATPLFSHRYKTPGVSGCRLSVFNLCGSASAPAPTRSGWVNPMYSETCSLFVLSLRFLPHSFPLFSITCSLFCPNTRGGGYLNTAAPRFTSDVICATWRRYPLWTHSIARILPVTTRVHPFARTRRCSLPTTHFCFKRGPRYPFPCAGRKAARRSAQTPHQLPMRPSLRPAAAHGRSAPTGIRQ